MNVHLLDLLCPLCTGTECLRALCKGLTLLFAWRWKSTYRFSKGVTVNNYPLNNMTTIFFLPVPLEAKPLNVINIFFVYSISGQHSEEWLSVETINFEPDNYSACKRSNRERLDITPKLPMKFPYKICLQLQLSFFWTKQNLILNH